ncbi:SHIRT domain-containing protein [Alterileibacterium massiliense]|uniref:SHIRT domain-containing protein n=1 Tax=Alterileibacterium massiliense TaxID=1870997 RepID=UPI0008D9AE3F|nr:SHIRT domain-containing protein [Alterileibacterium massiliense]
MAVNAAPVTTTQTVLKDGESKIVKTAEPVKGEVNKWKVTVRAEYNPVRKPTDVLIVLDRSGSMADGERDANGTVRENVPVDEQRMTNAKIGIQELTNRVLEQNKENKVALYSYSYGYANYNFYESLTKHTGFTQNPEDIKNSLTTIKPQGGTFTQMALHEADKAMSELKKQDTDGKRNRVVVLVTDGKPTVGYKVDIAKLSKEEGGLGNFFEWRTNIQSTSDYPQYYNDAVQNASNGSTTTATNYIQNGRYYTVGYGTRKLGSNFAARDAWVSNGKIPASTFIYSDGNPNTQEGRSNILNRIGWGCDIQYAMYGIDNNGSYMYWDIPENTVVEANAIKEAGNINDLYVVGLVTNDETNGYLKRMASPNKFYPSSSKNFQKTIDSILQQIKGEESIDESLKDIIGEGFAEPTEIKTTKGEAKYIKSADGTDNGHIDWKIGQPTQIKDENAPESDKVYYEELSYVLTMKDGWEKGGDKTLNTNGKTEVTVVEKFKEEEINNTTAEAISPEVDPIKLTIEKDLKGVDGANPAFPDETFNIELKGPDGSNYVKKASIKNGESLAIGDLKTAGTYKITEAGNYGKVFKITAIDPATKKEKTIETSSFTLSEDGSVKISGGENLATYLENDIKIVITNTEKKVKIGDYVWNDANNDGVQDATENPIKDVTVKLLDKDGRPVKDKDGKEIKTTTDASGKYLFEVAPGEYKVEIVAPDGYGMSNNQPKTTDNFVMKSGEKDLTKDFGLVKAKTYKVTHEFKVANDSSIKEFPARVKTEVEKQLPEEQTGKKNGEVVEPGALKNPGEVEDKANDGKWKFKAFIDQDPATEKVDAKINNADVNFVGEWTFVPNKHKVTYEYKSATPGKELPDELKKKAPEAVPDKVKGDKVTSPVPQGKEATFRDEKNKGTWKFKSYDKSDVTIVDKDEHVVGTWVFEKDPEPKTYKVTHKFESEDPNVELPEAVKKLTPSDQTGKKDASKVNPTTPAKTTVETTEGTWTFTGYDKGEKTVEGKDVEFIGKWKFTPKTYKVTHEFKVAKDSSIKEFPAGIKAEVEKQLPETETGKKNRAVVEPGALKNPGEVEDKANDGKWKFTKFIDQDPTTEKVDAKIDNADVNFVGEWTFVPNKHNVTYEYKSGTAGMEIPDALKGKAPKPVTGKVKGDKVTSPVPTGADATFRDETNKGTWKFKSYDKSDVTIVDKDEHVVGTWVFEKDSKPAVDGKDNPSSKDKPTTGDKGLELLFMSIVLMMSAGATVSFKKRKSNQDR